VIEAKLDPPQSPGACARREEILAAATRLFAERGFSQTDTQALAEELQVGKGTLYRYFPSKRDLFLAAVERVMVRLGERTDASVEGVHDPIERISRAIRAYLSFFGEHPEFVELLIQERALFKDTKTPIYFEHRKKNVERWRELYRSLIAAGRVRDMPVERITDVVSNAIYGTMVANYFTGQHKSPEQQAQDILDVVLNGILSDSERERTRLAGDPEGH
jgi:AcrR family transcriptional regulator